MISSYEAFKDLINSKLNANPNGIIFDTHLYNRVGISFQKETNNSGNYGVTVQKVIPTNVVEIVGNYINIPNTSVIENAISLEFDLYTRDYTYEPLLEQDIWKSVDYGNTLDSINNMIQELLATYNPLGNVGLYFGGTDSQGNFAYTTGFKWNTVYLKIDIKNTDSETLLSADDGASGTFDLRKTTTNIQLNIDSLPALTVPYTLGINEIYVYYDASNTWNLVNGANSDSLLDASVQNTYTSGIVDELKQYNGLLYQLLIDDSIITPTDIESGLENAISPKLNFKDFTSRYSFNQVGSYTLTTNTVENCILWGDEGNAIFGFETIVPISNVRFIDDGRPRQLFGLGINSIISKDILLGNVFEYFLDGEEIFPIDRQHTYGAENTMAQYFDTPYGVGINDSNAKDITQSFFYKPNKKLTELVKQATGNTEEQNKEYDLVVQFPFHKETYKVVIDSAGMPTNINTLTTFTVTYKQKDQNIV